jgi:transcriptional regulator with XRE-family HTH domain
VAEEMQDRAPHTREAARLALVLGLAIKAERQRRRMSIRALADLSSLSSTRIHDVETGEPASLETYVRLSRALHLRPEFDLVDRHRREHLAGSRTEDPVHAAMGEIEAAHFRGHGFSVGLDEPFQHFQFSGRADLVAWSVEPAALLHLENRTRFPNLQEAFGSFNAKRAYLGAELAGRLRISKWRSETHVMVALWSAETLHQLRLHRSSFESVCPDPPEVFDDWWRGDPLAAGRRSTLVLFDPVVGRRRDRLRWANLPQLDAIRPRYRDYPEALAALRQLGLA